MILENRSPPTPKLLNLPTLLRACWGAVRVGALPGFAQFPSANPAPFSKFSLSKVPANDAGNASNAAVTQVMKPKRFKGLLRMHKLEGIVAAQSARSPENCLWKP